MSEHVCAYCQQPAGEESIRHALFVTTTADGNTTEDDLPFYAHDACLQGKTRADDLRALNFAGTHAEARP